MAELQDFFRSGGVTTIVFIVFFSISVISMIASGKIWETFSLSVTLFIVYFLTIYDSINMITDSDLSMHASTGISSVPFLASMTGDKPSILNLINTDFALFSQQMLDIFILCAITLFVSEITRPLIKTMSSKSLILFGVSWLARFFFCNVSAVAYLMLHIYVIQFASISLLATISYVLFTLMLIVILSPIIEYLVVAAGLLPIPLLKNLSKFVKEHKLGGNLQSVFFSAFFLCALLICLQLTGRTYANTIVAEVLRPYL